MCMAQQDKKHGRRGIPFALLVDETVIFEPPIRQLAGQRGSLGISLERTHACTYSAARKSLHMHCYWFRTCRGALQRQKP